MPFPKGYKPTGRPKAPHTVKAEKAREWIVKQIAKNLEPIFAAKLDLALGHYYEGTAPGTSGKMKIYKTSPDGSALRYLIDQGIGRPKESVELSGSIKTLIVDE